MKRNPTNYNLTKGSFTVKDIDRIYDTFRRRARAAFTHQWGLVEDPTSVIARKLKQNAEAIEYGLTASWEEARTWAARGGLFASEEDRWEKAQKQVNTSKTIIRNYEAECFQRVRGKRHITGLSKPRDESATWMGLMKGALTRLRMAYPFVSAKNRPRLAKALSTYMVDFKYFHIMPKQLLLFGIPAAEIAGPWYTKNDIVKRPMDWVERGIFADRDRVKAYSSPHVGDWLEDAGLDRNDRQLVQSVEVYYNSHKTAPSVAWARQRSNELEAQRSAKDIDDQIPKVEEWLEASSYWRRSADYAAITIPELPDPTFRVLRPGDGELLCRAAQRNGLCVVDAITDLLDKAGSRSREPDEDYEEEFIRELFCLSEDENFVTLIISTDPKRRTVVGLNSAGVCTSEHHCTGIQNKVDKIAYEYFRKPSR